MKKLLQKTIFTLVLIGVIAQGVVGVIPFAPNGDVKVAEAGPLMDALLLASPGGGLIFALKNATGTFVTDAASDAAKGLICQSETGETGVGCVIEKALTYLGNLMIVLASKLLAVTAAFFEIGLEVSFNKFDSFINIPGVQNGWGTARDVANLFFIFILLYIAIGTILQLPGLAVKQAIIKLIVAALFINFSGTMTKIVIDAGNIIAVEFYNRANGDSGLSAKVVDSLGTVHLSGMFKHPNSPVDGNVETFAQEVGAKGFKLIDFIVQTLGGTIFILVTCFILVAAAVLFMIRTISLLFLYVLSPFAFLFFAMPRSSVPSRWWGALIKHTFFAPAYMLMFLISISIMQGGIAAASLTGGTALETQLNVLIHRIVFFIIATGFMVGSLIIASQMGAAGAGAAQAFGKRLRGYGTRALTYLPRQGGRAAIGAGRFTGRLAARGVGASGSWAARKTIGVASNRILDSRTLRNAEAKGGLVKSALASRVLDAAEGAQKVKIGAFGSQKKSFKEAEEDHKKTIKRRQERAKSVRLRDVQREARKRIQNQERDSNAQLDQLAGEAGGGRPYQRLSKEEKDKIFQQTYKELTKKADKDGPAGKLTAEAQERGDAFTGHVAARATSRIPGLGADAYAQAYKDIQAGAGADLKDLRKKEKSIEKKLEAPDLTTDKKEELENQLRDVRRQINEKGKESDAANQAANTNAPGQPTLDSDAQKAWNFIATGDHGGGPTMSAAGGDLPPGQAVQVNSAGLNDVIGQSNLDAQAGGGERTGGVVGAGRADAIPGPGGIAPPVEGVQIQGGRYTVTDDDRVFDTKRRTPVAGFQTQAILDSAKDEIAKEREKKAAEATPTTGTSDEGATSAAEAGIQDLTAAMSETAQAVRENTAAEREVVETAGGGATTARAGSTPRDIGTPIQERIPQAEGEGKLDDLGGGDIGEVDTTIEVASGGGGEHIGGSSAARLEQIEKQQGDLAEAQKEAVFNEAQEDKSEEVLRQRSLKQAKERHLETTSDVAAVARDVADLREQKRGTSLNAQTRAEQADIKFDQAERNLRNNRGNI